MFLMLSSSCYLRAALLLLPECSHSVTLTVLIISDRHTFMPLLYIYSLNPENNPMKNYYYWPHIKDEETSELSVCVICQGHNAINSRAGIQCHEPWLLLRGFESPRTLLSLVLSSYDFHSNRNLEAGNLHRTRAAVWLVSELEGLKVCIRDEWFSKAGPGRRWEEGARIGQSTAYVTSFPRGHDSFPQVFAPTTLSWWYKSVTPLTSGLTILHNFQDFPQFRGIPPFDKHFLKWKW